MTESKGAISRYQLDLFSKCRRCFWLLKRHGVKLPDSYPLALNSAMDNLLKQEFDEYRAKDQLHPILTEYGISARLFQDLPKLRDWRNNFKGLRWTDQLTGYTLFGAIDDLLEFPDGRLSVVDYKSSGAAQINVYPSYQLQLDVYTYLLERMGYPTVGKGYLAFFMAVKDDGFRGRLPFKGTLVEVPCDADRVGGIFRDAVALVESDRMPDAGEECDLCRWFDEADTVLGERCAP